MKKDAKRDSINEMANRLSIDMFFLRKHYSI